MRIALLLLLMILGLRADARDPVVFPPFRDTLAGRDASPTGEALAAYLERNLRLLRDLPKSIPSGNVREALDPSGRRERDRIADRELKDLCRKLGASEVFWGSFRFFDNRKTVALRFHQTDGDRSRSVEFSSVGETPFQVIDRLVLRLAEQSLWKIPENAERLLADRETDSVEAYGARLQGRERVIAKEWAEAAGCFAEALEIDPEYEVCRLSLGNCLFRMGDFAGARVRYEAVLEKDRRNWRALNNLAVLTKKEGDLREAVNLYGKSIGANPDSVRLRFNRGAVFAALRMDAEALHDFESCLKMDPRFAPAVYQLAVFHSERQAVMQSERYWREAVRLDDALLEECFRKVIPLDDILLWESPSECVDVQYLGRSPRYRNSQ